MNKRMVVMLAGGTLSLLILALLVQALFSGGSKKKEIVQKEITEILIAANNLEIGQELADRHMRWQEWPDHMIFPGAIVREKGQTATDAVDGQLSRKIAAGEPITESALIKGNDGNFLAANLKPGMRAMAIRVSAESSVGGFVTPGDHVDVILTYQVRVPRVEGAEEMAAELVSRNASQTVLENVRVLAVDQEAKPKDGAKVGRTVTLEVNGKGTETLALASSMGELSLVLRKLGDQTIGAAEDDFTTDVKISSVLQKIVESKDTRKTDHGFVRVYNGSAIQQQPVRTRISYTAQSQETM